MWHDGVVVQANLARDISLTASAVPPVSPSSSAQTNRACRECLEEFHLSDHELDWQMYECSYCGRSRRCVDLRILADRVFPPALVPTGK